MFLFIMVFMILFMKKFQMMKRLKYRVFWIVSLLSFFNLYTYWIVNECTINYKEDMTYNLKSSPWASNYPYEYNSYFNLVNINNWGSRTYTNTWWMMCFATMDVNDIHRFRIYLNWTQVWDLMWSYNVILTWACYDWVWEWVVYNDSSKFQQIFVQNFDIFNWTSQQCQSKYNLVSSSDLSSCQSSLSSCQDDLLECTSSTPECVLSVNQNNSDTDFTCQWDCIFDVYLDDDLYFTWSNNPWGYPYIEVTPLCSSSSWWNLTWINRSILHINWIEHVWAWFINITIPEEFERDYIYTWNWEELNIDVKWYNVDTAYIDWLITTQKTLPNNTDFNNTISWLLPLFVPWIVIIFFLYFIFRFIKKVF